MIRGIAFDLEGTVVDVETAHHNGHIAAAADFGLAITLDDAYQKLAHFIGGPDEKVCEDIWHLLPLDTQKKTRMEDILKQDKFHYERLLAEMPIAARPGFFDFYRNAANMGLRLTIGSLTPEKQAITLLARSGLSELFGENNIVLREHVVKPKPAPDVFLKTAEIMGINSNSQLVFEDSPRGVAAARAAGSKAVGMPVVIRGSVVGALVDAGVIRIFLIGGRFFFPRFLQILTPPARHKNQPKGGMAEWRNGSFRSSGFPERSGQKSMVSYLFWK